MAWRGVAWRGEKARQVLYLTWRGVAWRGEKARHVLYLT